MPEMHLRQPRFTWTSSGLFVKSKKFKNSKKQVV